MSLRIIFMGTPEFSIPSLKILLDHGYDLVGVITATDKWGGRGKKRLLESPVKKFAVKNGLHVLQPKNLKNPEFVEDLRALKADLQVVVAFRMLPEVVWNMPQMGTLNLHGSLLPKYRGAAPINWAIINGEKVTGVTTFLLKHEIDTGDMLFTEEIPIGPDDTAGDLHDRMMYVGAETVLKTVQTLESGNYSPVPQDNSKVSKAPKIRHEVCEINFNSRTDDVHNFIRGLSPFPGAWTIIDGKSCKILKAKKVVKDFNSKHGTIHTDQKTHLHIHTIDGYVEILEIQMEGKKRLEMPAFLNGYKITSGSVESA